MPYNPIDWVYDLESYPNVFLATFKHINSGTINIFEVSTRKNELNDLMLFLNALTGVQSRLIGFNNIGYDYPILHFIITNYYKQISYDSIYYKNLEIINTPWERRFDSIVPEYQWYISQIDLYKIHHFDNEARRTSLKVLEFNMRSDNIEDLPFPPGTILTNKQIETLIRYNIHDVNETEKFLFKSLDKIEFREELTKKYNKNFLNHSDKKIGTDYFIMKLEDNLPGSCYIETPTGRKPKQTIRPQIYLADAIFPYIKFEQPEFNRVLNWFKSQVITETKGVFEDVNVIIDGFKYVFGSGGIHGSIDSCIVESDDDYIITDWDVASYYPNLGIVNRLYPQHLSETFCDIYKDVFEQRKQYKKGTAENAMLKLALNGVFGDSNNKYSPFYDPLYTMSITINGQLLLCVLAEQLIKIPGLQVIQINTDGLTVKCPRLYIDTMNNICEWWQKFTCLKLEKAIYKRMFIRDVNNYIAEYENGKLKRKGAYEYKREWHQNHSELIVPMTAEAVLVRGEDVRQFISNHKNIFDFMLRAKVGKKEKLIFNNAQELQKTSRYYIAHDGGTLVKISPPVTGGIVGCWKRSNGITKYYYDQIRESLKGIDTTEPLDANGIPWDERINTKNKSKYKERKTAYNKGYLVQPCNDITTVNIDNINLDYYINEANKLIEPLRVK